MIGITFKRNNRNYRVPSYVTMGLHSDHNKLVFEGDEYLSAVERISKNKIYEFEISEFVEPSDKINTFNNEEESDTEFRNELESDEMVWQRKLATFKRLEKILKDEGVIK